MEITEVYYTDNNYGINNYYSKWLDMRAISSIRLTTIVNQVHSIGAQWSVDNNYNIIDTNETIGLTGYNSIQYPVRARYCRLFVRNIAVTPCSITLQAFYKK